MNSKTKNVISVESNIAACILVVTTATMGMEKAKADLSIHLATAFKSVAKNDVKAFALLFGNGEPPKSKAYSAGSIASAVRTAIAKVSKDKQKKALDILKTRLSECRKAFKAGIVLTADESVQTALKRIPKSPKAPATPENKDKAFEIPANASMDDVAEALSVWVATHGNAAAGLSKKLADFLPISTKRTIKAA